MKQRKVLVIDDFPRKHHYMTDSKKGILNEKQAPDYMNIEEGIILKSMLGHVIDNLHTDDPMALSFDVKYAYPKVPNVTKENKRDCYFNAYQAPKQSEVSPYFERIEEVVTNGSYDVIIPIGNIALRSVGVNEGILKAQGNIFSFCDTTVIPLVSPRAVQIDPAKKNLWRPSMIGLIDYLYRGEAVKEKKVALHYRKLLTYDEVINLFKFLKTRGGSYEHPITLDYETNTLIPQLDGSKMLTLSVSWAEGYSATFPVEHPQYPWTSEQLDIIMRGIKQLLEDNRWVCFHNASFDIRFTKMVMERYGYGRLRIKNVLDTMVAYYIGVSQSKEISSGLKDLASQYTEMGDYEKDLTTYKEWFFSLKSKKVSKIAQQYDKTFLAKYFLQRDGKYEITDDDWLSYMTDSDKEYVLLYCKKLSEEFKKASDVTNKLAPKKKTAKDMSYEWIPYDILVNYANGDTDATIRLHNIFFNQYIKQNENFVRLYAHHYPELLNALTDIECNGINVDADYLNNVNKRFGEEMDRLLAKMREQTPVQVLEQKREDIYFEYLEMKAKKPAERDKPLFEELRKIVGTKGEKRFFNPASIPDMQEVLFKRTGYRLPAEKKYLTEAALPLVKSKKIDKDELQPNHFKTNKAVVEALIAEHPEFKKLGELILSYKQIAKVRGTYTESLLAYVDSQGVLHGQFKMTGTETTRLASSNPNLQNIPKPPKDTKEVIYRYPIKKSFQPHFHKGQDLILNIDYSSQEAHIAAVLAYDEKMIGGFLEGRDVHTETAAMVFNVPEEEVTKAQRQAAKSTTFGILYGENAASYFPKHTTIDSETGEERPMTKEDAEELFKKYFDGKPKIKDLIEDAKREVKQKGYAEIPGSGFRRDIQTIDSKDFIKRGEAERQALNTKIQGGAAYMTQLATIAINDFLIANNYNAEIIVTVHDSITLSVARKDAKAVAEACEYLMEHLPLPYFHFEFEGKMIDFRVEAEPDAGICYAYETPFEWEDYETFNSSLGYSWYYEQLSRLKARKEGKHLSNGRYEQLVDIVKSHKPRYQALMDPRVKQS